MSSKLCDKQQNVVLINNLICNDFIPPASLLSRNGNLYHFTDMVKKII